MRCSRLGLPALLKDLKASWLPAAVVLIVVLVLVLVVVCIYLYIYIYTCISIPTALTVCTEKSSICYTSLMVIGSKFVITIGYS